MASYYSVIQYVPDPITDERMNIGVIVYGDGTVRAQFTENWTRVRNFAHKDIKHLRDFADAVEEAASSQRRLPEELGGVALTEDAVPRITRHWVNSIQVTEPKVSLDTAEALLEDAASRFLYKRERRQSASRGRVAARHFAVACVKDAIREVVHPSAVDYVKSRHPIDGALEAHKLDFVVENGHAYFGGFGLSFEKPADTSFHETMASMAWALDDVRKKDEEIPLAVIALPPEGESEAYERAQRIFPGLKVEFLPAGQAARWAAENASLVARGAA